MAATTKEIQEKKEMSNIKELANKLNELSEAVDVLTERLISLKKRTRWTPCYEMMPDRYIDEYGNKIPFLVSIPYRQYPIMAFYDGVLFYNGLTKYNVTAWRPLPQKYKEAEHEEKSENV